MSPSNVVVIAVVLVPSRTDPGHDVVDVVVDVVVVLGARVDVVEINKAVVVLVAERLAVQLQADI